MLKTGQMTKERFDFLTLSQGRPMKGKATDTARDVLTKGKKLSDAAKQNEVSEAAVRHSIKRILEREDKLLKFLQGEGYHGHD